MPGRKDQRKQELKQAAQSCWKLTYIFKKSNPSKELKELPVNENQGIATSNLENEG